MGPHPGGQAELVRVRYADYNCLNLPGTPNDEFEDDFVLLADVFPTGYHATEQAHVRPGDTVAIFGAGPVGLLAALSSKIKGASEIYVVDNVKERLALAASIGAIPIDFSHGDAVEQILAKRRPHVDSVQNLREGAGDKMAGVMCTIDAIGYEAKEHGSDDTANAKRQDPVALLGDLVRLTNPTGHIGIIGVYFPQDPGGKGAQKEGVFEFPLGQAWNKGISIEMGQAPVKQYNVYLRDLILAGVAKPSFIVSHRLPLDEAPDAYKQFESRTNGFTKVLLKPQKAA
jgi:glutathione-independent formaldehyde dehydrogenase